MGYGVFTAHASFTNVRITSPVEGLAYAQALPAATQARPHWQAVIATAANADETEVLIDHARDALKNALVADKFFVKWSE